MNMNSNKYQIMGRKPPNKYLFAYYKNLCNQKYFHDYLGFKYLFIQCKELWLCEVLSVTYVVMFILYFNKLLLCKCHEIIICTVHVTAEFKVSHDFIYVEVLVGLKR